MFIEFFRCIRRHGVAASVTELLDFLEALQAQVVFADVDDFYHLARLTLVKDERFYDRFDRAFAEYFEGVSETELGDAIPAEWLTGLWLVGRTVETVSAAFKRTRKAPCRR